MPITTAPQVFRRIKLRLFLRKHTDNQDCYKALRDPTVFGIIFDELDGAYMQFPHEGGVEGPVTDFFEWLLAHADEIFAIIARIIKLFPTT